MEKLTKHKVVYVPPKEGEYEEDVVLVRKENVYVLTESELKNLLSKYLDYYGLEMRECNEMTDIEIMNEFIKQNI